MVPPLSLLQPWLAQTGVYLAIVTIEKIIVMLVMLLPFWQSVRWSRQLCPCLDCARHRHPVPHK
jgi:hypothetical protein